MKKYYDIESDQWIEYKNSSTPIPTSEWKWFGYPGHFCAAASCQFRLCTQVGKYLISTVGDYRPRGAYEGKEVIGGGKEDFFETYVFNGDKDKTCSVEGCGCGMPEICLSEIEGRRAATASEATAMHMELCHKYANLRE